MKSYHDLYANRYEDIQGTQEPDTGMIQIPQPGTQTPDTGMIQAPPPAPETPDTGMIPLPPIADHPSSHPGHIMFLMQRCMNNMMFVHTRNGDSFWFYPTSIFQQTVNGYRWNQQAGWFSYSLPISSVHDAFCYS